MTSTNAVRKRQSGTAAVEFAVVVFVLLLVGAGIVEFGRALWYYDAVAKGTRDAARYMSTVPTPSLGAAQATAQDIVVRAATAAGVAEFAGANVTITCEPTVCGSAVMPADVARIRVQASYPMTLGALFPFIFPGADGTLDVTLSPRTTMPYMW